MNTLNNTDFRLNFSKPTKPWETFQCKTPPGKPLMSILRLLEPGPEGFVNLPGLLVQSKKNGLASVQYSSAP